MGLQDLSGAVRPDSGPMLHYKGAAVATVSAARTLTFQSSPVQKLTFSGGNQDVNLPAASTALDGAFFWIYNVGTSNSGVVKTSGGSTLATLAPKDFGLFEVSSGEFVAAVLSQPGTSIATGAITATTVTATGAISGASVAATGAVTGASATISGALAAGATTITGAMTTTDGVVGGTARKTGGLAANIVASGTLGPTGGTAETALATYTIPANTIKAGTLIKVTAGIMATAETGATTCTLRCRLGGVSGTLIVGTAAFDLNSADNVQMTASIVGRAAPGAAASVATQGKFEGKMANTVTQVYLVNAPANFATNGVLDLVLTGQMSASDANAIACTIFAVEVIG